MSRVPSGYTTRISTFAQGGRYGYEVLVHRDDKAVADERGFALSKRERQTAIRKILVACGARKGYTDRTRRVVADYPAHGSSGCWIGPGLLLPSGARVIRVIRRVVGPVWIGKEKRSQFMLRVRMETEKDGVVKVGWHVAPSAFAQVVVGQWDGHTHVPWKQEGG